MRKTGRILSFQHPSWLAFAQHWIALPASLTTSALLIALSRWSPALLWVHWVAIIPLFWSIRRSGLFEAGLWCASWGLLVHLFASFDPRYAGSLSAVRLAVMIAVPGLYGILGAALTHRIGFSPFVMGVAWTAVGFVIEPATGQSHVAGIHWVGATLGYVVAGFVVAYANALLLTAICETRVVPPFRHPFIVSWSWNGASPRAESHAPRLDTSGLSQPRGPPPTVSTI